MSLNSFCDEGTVLTRYWRRPSLTRELAFPFRAAGSVETPLINRLQLVGTIIYNQVELRFRTVPFRNHYSTSFALLPGTISIGLAGRLTSSNIFPPPLFSA